MTDIIHTAINNFQNAITRNDNTAIAVEALNVLAVALSLYQRHVMALEAQAAHTGRLADYYQRTELSRGAVDWHSHS